MNDGKKIWGEKTFKEYVKEEIAKGKTPDEQRDIEWKFCLALMLMDCSGLQGFGK